MPVMDGTPCDGNLLSVVDQCNEAQCRSGVCVVVPLNGTPCSDGNPCTIQPGMPSFSCFMTFFFSHSVGTLPPSDMCMSQSAGPSVCVGSAGYCDTEERVCNVVRCVSDTSSSPVCLIEPLPFGTTCDDHNACTLNDVCQRTLVVEENVWRDTGVCEGTPVSCDSGAPCILATCQPVVGCVYDSSALDGVACNSSTDVRRSANLVIILNNE